MVASYFSLCLRLSTLSRLDQKEEYWLNWDRQWYRMKKKIDVYKRQVCVCVNHIQSWLSCRRSNEWLPQLILKEESSSLVSVNIKLVLIYLIRKCLFKRWIIFAYDIMCKSVPFLCRPRRKCLSFTRFLSLKSDCVDLKLTCIM